MTLPIWIVLGVLHGISLVWYFMVRRDVVHYAQTKLKLVGEEHMHEVITPFLRRSVQLYGIMMGVVTIGFTFYLYWFYA